MRKGIDAGTCENQLNHRARVDNHSTAHETRTDWVARIIGEHQPSVRRGLIRPTLGLTLVYRHLLLDRTIGHANRRS